MKQTYNGWTNYATWRINLEVFDNFDISDYFIDGFDTTADDNVYELSEYLKEYLMDYLTEVSSEGLARDYAMAFISDVNFYEIAEHLIGEQND